MDKHKLGVIVPFRNRHKHLKSFLSGIQKYLDSKGIDYVVIVVEQDDAKLFNRGMILNVGFMYAKKYKCDYVVFHDVDMIPIKVDYGYGDYPIHMATNFRYSDSKSLRETFKEYFGGVTLFPVEDFEKINGYSNKYWGWGFEDDDLLFRCKLKNIKLDTLIMENVLTNHQILKFNGVNAYVECQNVIDFNLSATFVINFDLSEFVFDHTQKSDEFTAFSVPGWDFAIAYTSFLRYNFCAFDSHKKPYYINSEIISPHKTTVVVVMDRNENKFKMYVGGEFVGETENFQRLYPYRKEPYFYLGVGNPKREVKPNYLKGVISSFSYYDEILSEEEIKKISFGDVLYTKVLEDRVPKVYYDGRYVEDYKFIDLSGNGVKNTIVNCEITDDTTPKTTIIPIPHRKKGLFWCLTHENNGFGGDGWKSEYTRWNQLRFHNEVKQDPSMVDDDGLSDLEYVEWGKKKDNNVLHVNVGI